MVTLPLLGWVFTPTLVLIPSDKDVITHPFEVRIIGACWGTLLIQVRPQDILFFSALV